MAGMDDYLVRILKLAQDDPRYRQLAEYLVSRRSMPKVQMRYMGDINAEFESSAQGQGSIRLNDNFSKAPESAVNTLVHEMTHATKEQMGRQWFDLYRKPNKTPEELQFIENYQKILSGTAGKHSGLLSQMRAFDPEWVKKNAEYRASYDEGPAFAIGDLGKNYSAYDAPKHLDPSVATQYMMLLDQAQKLQSAQYNRSQGR